MNGLARPCSAPRIVVSRLPNSDACVSADRRDDRAPCVPSAGRSAPRCVRGADRFLRDRDDVAQQRPEGADRGVERLAAAGEARRRSRRGSPAAASRVLLVEHVEELVELDRLRRRPARAGSCRRPGSPASTCPRVISTYLRPSAERGRTISVESLGSGPTSLSSLSVEHGDHACRCSSVSGLIALDRADARAADPDVVADDQVGGVGQLGLERRRSGRTAGPRSRCRTGRRRRGPRAPSRRRSAPGCRRCRRRDPSSAALPEQVVEQPSPDRFAAVRALGVGVERRCAGSSDAARRRRRRGRARRPRAGARHGAAARRRRHAAALPAAACRRVLGRRLRPPVLLAPVLASWRCFCWACVWTCRPSAAASAARCARAPGRRRRAERGARGRGRRRGADASEVRRAAARRLRRVGRALVDDQPGAQVVADRVEAVDRGHLVEDVVHQALDAAACCWKDSSSAAQVSRRPAARPSRACAGRR